MTPRGFWSYARGDDEHLDKRLTELRGLVAGEVSMLLGRDVDMFQDIYDIRAGDEWEVVLRDAVTSAAFLIPVLTPRYFNRDWCREETLTFLRIATEKGVKPLIFPIRFVEFDPEEGCEVRAALAPYQYKDFTGWRFESDPTQRERMLNAFAKDVKAKLTTIAEPRPKPRPDPAPTSTGEQSAEAPDAERPEPPPARYKTFHVDPLRGRADFSSIAAAIEAAPEGSRIVVRPGTYRESLRLSKALELVGEGDPDRIVVTSAKGAALHCDASMARVSGMTFRREAGGNDAAVWITAGAVEIEDCAATSASLACVIVQGGDAAPTLRRCRIHDGAQGGLFAFNGARPVVEDCEFYDNAYSGAEINGEGTHAILRRCVAHDGRQSGYFVQKQATALMEECEAIGNANSGITISDGADPTVRACRIRGNHQGGVFINQGGRGLFEDCEIAKNDGAGIAVKEGGEPVARSCRISENGYQAVWIIDAESGGTFENNDLRDNARGAWKIAKGGEDKVVRRNNTE